MNKLIFFSINLIIVLYFIGTSSAINYFEAFAVQPNIDESNNRNAVKLEIFKWPNGIVPYIFHKDYEPNEIKIVQKQMIFLSRKTCVKFISKLNRHREHIQFIKSLECGASIGFRLNRTTPLNVTYSSYCLGLPGAIQHELLHVLGLFHEHARPDRDEYIKILWENIDPAYFQNFLKIDNNVVDTFGFPYDFNSLMHYPNNAFAKNDQNVTIVSMINPFQKLGQSDEPTFNDLEKIKKMYDC